MPIRLILSIVFLVLVTIFAGVNLDNKCDITFIFYTFKEIPVFMTVIISFAIGAVLMVPFTLGLGKKKKTRNLPQKQNSSQQTESRTLFDFKIKREAKKDSKSTENTSTEEKSESKSDSTKTEKNGGFFGKILGKKAKNEEKPTEENIGAPV